MVEFKYEIAGAYYPAPNAEFPADARPAENFIRFYEIKSNQVCTTGLPSVALNLHPTGPVRVAYTDANANPAKPVVIIIPPLGGHSIGCTDLWSKFIDFTFDFAE